VYVVTIVYTVGSVGITKIGAGGSSSGAAGG